MATLGTTMTLVDLAKANETEDTAIVELLSKNVPLVEDMAWRNGNQIDGHMFRVRDGLPAVGWRSINQGITSTKSSTKTVRETCGMLEAVSEIDKKLVDLEESGKAQAMFRVNESAAFLEAMAQEFARAVWYGDTSLNPKEIIGLSKRYGSLTDEAGDRNQYVIDCGGTGNDNASIWLIVHSTESFFGIVPKGDKTGLQHVPSGVIDLIDPDNGGTYQGYRDRFMWTVGVCVKDYRQIVRACNIDVSDLPTSGTSSSISAKLLETVNTMTNRVQNLKAGRPVFYMNRTLKEYWERELLTSHYIEKNIDQATGEINVSYKGIPFHVDDMLLNTEEAVA